MRPSDLCIDPALPDRLRSPENEELRRFFDYWQSKMTADRLPGRADIEPTEIPQLLPNIFLIDVVAGTPPRFCFRLVGTRIVEMEFEMTGRFLDEMVPQVYDTAMGRHYLDAIEGKIYLRRTDLRWRQREHIDYDVLLLPLADDGMTVNRLFGLALYRRR
ncbi:MAG TPA: PAS domain-containing protein [Dongiaceae bacterium]|jgi:hypothetical protein|nr:PAS domain-containing protein [Dongiaceae bacterium]